MLEAVAGFVKWRLGEVNWWGRILRKLFLLGCQGRRGFMYRKFLSVLLAPCKTEWVLSCKRSWRTKKGFSVFRRVQIFDLHHQFRASFPFPVLNFHSAHWIQETDKSNYCNKYSLEVSFKKKTFTKMELLLNRRETLSASTQLSVNPLCLFLIPTAAESLEPGESQCSLQPSK